MVSDQNDSNNLETTGADTVEERSIWSIMAGIFTAPTEAFAAFNRKPQIIIVLVVTLLLGMISSYFIAEYQAQMQYDMVSQSATIPAQSLDQMREGIENPSRITGALLGAAGQLFAGVIVALLAWALGSFIFGGDSTFKKVWGVSLLGGLIMMVGALVKLPLIMAKGSMYVSFGLAALFPEKDFTSIVYSVLFYLDAFLIWAMVVSGIGYAAIFNITRGKGIAIAIILDIIMISVMIGLMAIGMSFAGVELTFF